MTKGAGQQEILQVVSHVASKSFQEIREAAVEGQQVAFQLYMKSDRSVWSRSVSRKPLTIMSRKKSEEAVKNAVKLGAHSIWLTVDTVAVR